VHLNGELFNPAGEIANFAGYFKTFLVDLIGVNRERRVDLVFTLCGNEEDCSLESRNTRQNQIEQDEGVGVKAVPSVEKDPDAQKCQSHENKGPGTHAVSNCICRNFPERAAFARKF
jgi:hypothetical protein